MRTYFKYFILVSLSLTVGSAHADILCAKKSQKVSKNAVAISSALLVSSTTCPTGYTKIIDTTAFKGDDGEAGATGAAGAKGDKGETGSTGATGAQGVQGIQGATGPQGDAGLAAIAHSTCQTRHQQFVHVVDNTHRVVSVSRKNCDSGEYAHAAKAVASYAYSNDWSYDIGEGVETEGAGASGSYNNQQGSNELRQAANVFDAEDLFLIGYEVISGIDYSDYLSITGSFTLTYDITLTCCLLGD